MYSKNDKAGFWNQHFQTDSKGFSKVFSPHSKCREFSGTFRTDGYGVRIIKQKPEAQTGAGRKRKAQEKRKDRDTRLFASFNTVVERNELRQSDNVVFAGPNMRDKYAVYDGLELDPRKSIHPTTYIHDNTTTSVH